MLLSSILLSALPIDVPAQPVASSVHGEAPATAVEEHQFTGSSTSVAAFQAWFAGEDFVKPNIETRDLRTLDLPNGEEAQAGDVIVKGTDGEFFIK